MHFIFHRPWVLKWVLNLWPPFFFAGIKVQWIDDDFTKSRVILKWRPWTRNFNRTQYGGSIFSMTDGMFALMLYGILGKGYVVWDKRGYIEYVKPGVGEVHADFEITREVVDDILQKTSNGEKVLPEFVVSIKDREGNLVSRVTRELYVRKLK